MRGQNICRSNSGGVLAPFLATAAFRAGKQIPSLATAAFRAVEKGNYSDLRLTSAVPAEEDTVIDILVGVGYPHGEFACGYCDLAVKHARVE